jgi:hypothetical protein
MATFTITINSTQNNPPNQVGNVTFTLDHGGTKVFSKNDFTINTIPQYNDPEGDDLLKIKITNLNLVNGVFRNTNTSSQININDEILTTDLNSGFIVYDADNTNNDEYSASFSFQVADVGSSTYYTDEDGIVTLDVNAYENLEPTQVGDNSITIEYGETIIFTRAMFTSQTTPPYSDPEGDAALNLKITGLPQDGAIKLNGSNVLLNDIISFSDIDAGLLRYTPDLTDVDGDIENFTFEIADAGSGIFVG